MWPSKGSCVLSRVLSNQGRLYRCSVTEFGLAVAAVRLARRRRRKSARDRRGPPTTSASRWAPKGP
eukprot:2395585-Pyramimonas_sp.AAC.1